MLTSSNNARLQDFPGLKPACSGIRCSSAKGVMWFKSSHFFFYWLDLFQASAMKWLWLSPQLNWEVVCCCIASNTFEHMWPCITKPTKSCMAQFCVMARNRWSGSAWVIFRFWYILKEQSFFYIILKFGSIKRIISRVFCWFSRPIFLRSDGSCDHNTCPIISLYKLDYLAYFEPL